MQNLKELAQIVNKNKLRKIELLQETESDSKIFRLYEGILDGRFHNDEEASEHFYGESRSSAYRKLKSSLKERLYNHLFFIDVKQASYTDRQRAYYESFRYWAAAKIMLGKHARNAGIELTEKLFQQAQQYEFTELCLDISHILRLHYGTRLANEKKYHELNTLYHRYQEAFIAENLAEEYYTQIMLDFVNSKSAKSEKREQAIQLYGQLEPHLKKSDSYRLHLYAFLIELSIYTSVNDYQGALQVSERMIRFFEDKPYVAAVPLLGAHYQQFICYLQLRDFEKGRQAALRCADLVEEGSFNWFKYQELYILLCLRSGAYQEGYDVFEQAKEHKRFSFLQGHVREYWRVMEAYFYLLQLNGLINQEQKSHFRLGKFLNELPIYSRDKQGVNITILIVQIAVMLSKQQFGMVIDRMEAIEKYCTRHLQQGNTYRSYYFIKMLLQIPVAGFHQDGVIRKTQEYWTKLQNTPLEDAEQTVHIELIPYEDLWEIMQSLLPRRFPRLRQEDRARIRT